MIHSPRFKSLVEEVKGGLVEISIAELKQFLDQGKLPFYLIDVREQEEWDTGHLPQAVHLSKGIIERDIEKTVPDINTPLVLYCSGGFRSILAADNLRKMGYLNVRSMAGGSRAWKEAYYPIVA